MTNFMFLSSEVDSLVEYFNKSFGGTLEVEGQFESLEMNMDSLMNNNIRADKLIIIFKEDSDFNIKREIGCLGRLIESNYFFRINEILLFSENNQYCLDGINFFKAAMDSIEYSNYSVKVYEDGISTAQVYRDVMGIVPDDFTTTSYTKVYRREVGSESRVGYSPRRSKGSIVKSVPDNYSRYNDYKENMKKTETGRVIVENKSKEIPNIDIELESYESKIDSIRNIVIFTGNNKSGTTVLACKTFIKSYRNSIMVDLTKGLGSINMLNYMNDSRVIETPSIEFINNSDLLFDDFNSDKLKLLGYNKKDKILDYLKYVLSIPNRIKYDTMFIDCDLEDLDYIINLVDQRLKKLIFTTESSLEEYKLLEGKINHFSRFNCYLFLNNHLHLNEGYTPLSPEIIINLNPRLNIVSGENVLLDDIDLNVFL